jgi:hypothetical protein
VSRSQDEDALATAGKMPALHFKGGRWAGPRFSGQERTRTWGTDCELFVFEPTALTDA